MERNAVEHKKEGHKMGAYGIFIMSECGIFLIAFIMAIFVLKKKNTAFEFSSAWYKDMAEQDKKRFWGVIATCAVGTVMILLVPVVFRFIL
ncbi:hypothetical protein D5278_05150 [bacterium 1XD21-13]|nr:hypothetical protein [bacterium 1XD21-13]